jgi:acyl-coenzyme A synthetase/AMP-(fatty) acid ligase
VALLVSNPGEEFGIDAFSVCSGMVLPVTIGEIVQPYQDATVSGRLSLRHMTLRALSPDRFISDDHTLVSVSSLLSQASIEAHQTRGRAVLLKTTEQLPSVLALLELDGIAARVVLCPPDQWQHAEEIAKRASIDVIVDDTMVDSDLGKAIAYGARCVDTEWVLLTSGTTGLPKMAIHTLSSLAGPLDDGMSIAPGAVWSTFYDVRRYGGLQILLRALLGGGSLILSSQEETPTEFLRRLGRTNVTHISGTPSHWRRALMSEAVHTMAPSYVRLSGEIVDQAVLDRLHNTYPEANVGHAYATTEAGVGFDVRDGKAGFPASYIGNPSLKAELKVENGTLHIRSPRTARGYIGGPLRGSNGFVDTGDLVERRNDRYYFLGRQEGVINVGGQKVYPEEVETVLMQHPAIKVARVWPKRNSVIGFLVAADVVLDAEAGGLASVRNDIIEHCRNYLAPWKGPHSLRQVVSVEISPAGKISRRA